MASNRPPEAYAAGSIIQRELERSAEPVGHHAPYWAYHRVSSEEQKRRKTIEGQRSDTLAWALMKGVQFDRTEEDDGHSGATITGRQGFRRVLEACENGLIGTLVVTAPDRLTRAEEWGDRSRIWSALRRHRTLLVMTGFCDIDPFAESADLLLGQAFTLASMERKRMRQRSFRGKMRAAESRRLPQGKAPNGRTYDRASGLWSLVDEEVAIYRRIFALAIDGKSTNEIPAVLNREGVPSPGRKSWSQSYVSELLRSSAALGEYTTLGQSFLIPAVVDRSTFERAGYALDARRQQHGARLKHPRLLNKLMVCGVCGHGVHVRTCGKPANKQQAYVCGQAHPSLRAKVGFVRPDCSQPQHNADAVDRVVWAEVQRLVGDPDLLGEAMSLGAAEGAGDKLTSEIGLLEKELKNLDRQKQNLLRLFRKELADEGDLERQLQEVRGQEHGTKAQRDALLSQREATAALSKVTGDLAIRMKSLEAAVRDAPVEERRELVAAIFPRRAPYGLRLFPDGRIDAIGTLSATPEQPLPPPNSSESGAELPVEQTTAARRSPGCSSHPPQRSSRAARAPASPG